MRQLNHVNAWVGKTCMSLESAKVRENCVSQFCLEILPDYLRVSILLGQYSNVIYTSVL